jgi:hypothetical protein
VSWWGSEQSHLSFCREDNAPDFGVLTLYLVSFLLSQLKRALSQDPMIDNLYLL